MRIGIRLKVAISFIIVILVPLTLTTYLSMKTILEVQKDPVLKVFWERDAVEDEILGTVRRNFHYIEYYNNFYNRISPQLEKHKVSLKIIDPKNVILFDSENKYSYGQFYFVHKDNFFEKQFQVGFKSEKHIMIANKHVATAIFTIDRNQRLIIETLSKYFFKSFGLGLLSLIGLITLFTWYISSSILKPLRQLNSATENILEGNLDFQIQYNQRDELGRFCKTFDLMRKKLKESLEAQEKSERAKKEMLASISHDFRTPISSIKGYVEGLQDGLAEDEETFLKYLKIIKDKTDKLDYLIDEFFNISQMEVGKITFNFEIEDSEILFKEIFNNIEFDIKNCGIKLEIEDHLPEVPIRVDRGRIEQVIDNLIDNAKRYIGKEGKIKIGIVQEDKKIIVYISDNGAGIDKKDLPFIFDKFYRGEKSRSSKYGGAGLGLSICKYLIDAHGGEIWVESEKGKGSTFYFSLPVQEKSQAYA